MFLTLLGNMIVIGLTGGICSGKSSIATILRDKCNAEVIDADKLGHQARHITQTHKHTFLL